MRIFLMIFLASGSGILFPSCRTIYKNLSPVSGHTARDLDPFRPGFGVGLYKASVDITGRHLSGLVVIKKMADSSIRVVFTSEAGPGFFDFSWPAEGGFYVQSILPQLNRKSVIKTLRKDFELVLMNRLFQGDYEIRENENNRYYIFKRPKGYDAYITSRDLSSLTGMERSSKKKPVVKATTSMNRFAVPDTIVITHQQFEFRIELIKIERNVEE